MSGDEALRFEDVAVWFADGTSALSGVNWVVRRGEHWAVLGPNGAGKSTLLGLVGAERLPSTGKASVLNARLGRVDLRELREHIGVVDVRMRMPAELCLLDYVLTGTTQTVVLRPERVDAAARRRAHELLDMLGLAAIAKRPTDVLSQGERARARLARSLLPRPSLLVLDEPAAGLDLPGRADLLQALTDLARSEAGLTTVTAVHHVEELPSTTTHAALLRDGRMISSGALEEILADSALLSECFGRPVSAFRADGRWYAVAHPGAGRPMADTHGGPTRKPTHRSD